MTAREQLVVEVMWTDVEWRSKEHRSSRMWEGTAEEEGGGTAIIKGEKGPRWDVMKEQTSSS